MISVESVVSKNFPDFITKRPKVTKKLVTLLRYLFHENEFKRFEKNYSSLKGIDFVDQALEYFDFSYSVNNIEKERIPAYGKVVIVANHPIGSLDGLALLKLVSEIRSDVKVVANDLLMAINPLHNLLLPVNNMGSKTVKNNIKAIDEYLKSNGAIVIFPAGEVSRMSPKGVRDSAWNSGFLRFAARAKAPILPVYADARNSVFFYSLSFLSKPISTLWLVREMFKQARKDISFRIGKPVSYSQYNEMPFDLKSKAKLFRKHVYKLSKNKGERLFTDNIKTIAHPESRRKLREEIRQCELLGSTSDNKSIYLYKYLGDSSVMREIGRLREVSFREVGEGTGRRRDVDNYDGYYDHIVLWDDEDIEIVGAYRLAKTSDIINDKDLSSLYTNTLFDYSEEAEVYLSQAIELGRSFVQPKYWGKRSLDYLWFGIGAYLKKNQHVRYLMGPVSISNSYGYKATKTIVEFYSTYYSPEKKWAAARNQYNYSGLKHKSNSDSPQFSNKETFSDFKSKLKDLGCTVPVLYKQYSELCENGGVQFVDFNIDEDFSNCVDGLVVVDLKYLKQKKRERYLQY